MKTKAKVSNKMQQKLAKQNNVASAAFSRTSGNATSLRQNLQKASGTCSSVIAYTPVNGFEIVVDQPADSAAVKDDADDGYFSSIAQFKKPKL